MYKTGLVHVFYGYGQGKTTAAVGLAVRATGAGNRVLFTQFLKNGRSGELDGLRKLGVDVLAAKPCKFSIDMSDEERAQAAREQHAAYTAALEKVAAGGVDLLVLDEALDAVELGMLGAGELLEYLKARPVGLEVVLTGHKPFPGLAEAADYVTECVKHRHPYDRGVKARKGAEY